jgi:protein phosphatase
MSAGPIELFDVIKTQNPKYSFMTTPLKISVAALSHKGMIRKLNEDTYVVATDLSGVDWNAFRRELTFPEREGILMMIADGMGGMEAGEIASSLAVQAVEEFFRGYGDLPISEHGRSTFLLESIFYAHTTIADNGKANPDRMGMGTTVILAWVSESRAHLAWCGDSRAYLYRPEIGLKLLTDDHAYVWEKVMKGELTPEEARLHPDSNIITQSLGDDAFPPSPETAIVSVQPGDRLMLCSDGLSGMLSDREIEEILEQGMLPNQTCQVLVDAANKAGGNDNITVTLVELLENKVNGNSPHEEDTSFQHIKGRIKNWLIK